MEINGTIYKILPTEEVAFGDGTKKMKGGFVIMREGEYPKPVAFELFGEERLALLNGITNGMPVKVNFLPVSFEGKNGGFFTTLRCINILPQSVASATVNTNGSTTDPVPNGNDQWNPFSDVASMNDSSFGLLDEEKLPF